MVTNSLFESVRAFYYVFFYNLLQLFNFIYPFVFSYQKTKVKIATILSNLIQHFRRHC